MFEKLLLFVFGKFLDVLLEMLLGSDNPKHLDSSRMAAHKLLLRDQADNAMALLERGGALEKRHFIKFTLPGNISPKDEVDLMQYARRYVKYNYDPWDFDELDFTWSKLDVKVNRKQQPYTKSLPHRTWSEMEYEERPYNERMPVRRQK